MLLTANTGYINIPVIIIYFSLQFCSLKNLRLIHLPNYNIGSKCILDRITLVIFSPNYYMHEEIFSVRF